MKDLDNVKKIIIMQHSLKYLKILIGIFKRKWESLFKIPI